MSQHFRGVLLVVPMLLLASCSSDDGPADLGDLPVGVPVTVTDLAVDAATETSITLAWTTPGVPGDTRPLVGYDLRRASFGAEPASWDDWQDVEIGPPAEPGARAQAVVDGLAPSSTWVFKLRSHSSDAPSLLSPAVVATAANSWDQTPPDAIDDLELRWRSEDQLVVTFGGSGDDGGYGEAHTYEARWASQAIDEAGWDAAALSEAPAFDADIGRWTARLSDLDPEATVHLAVRARDDAGNWSDLSASLAVAPPAANVWHVRVDGSGTVGTIAEAIDLAGVGDLILVHPGRYTWTNQGPMDDLGMLFFAREVDDFIVASAEGPESTILDAEGQGTVIFIQGYNDNLTIEGFTITGGAVAESGNDDYPLAGGVTFHLTSPTIRDCIFEDNDGGQGGAMGYFGVGSPRIERCVFRNNHAEVYGGAIYAVNVHGNHGDLEYGIEILDCSFQNNTSNHIGGAFCFFNAVARVRDCIIVGNTAVTSGGGALVAGRAIADDADTWVEFERCTFDGNEAPLGGAVRVSTLTSFDQTEVRHGQGRLLSCIVANHDDDSWFSLRTDTVLEVGCCAFHANGIEDAVPAVVIELGDCFWLDPLFCGAGGPGGWELSAASPCLPGAHPDGSECGRIGARDQGCAAR